jgi:hypothetical protein
METDGAGLEFDFIGKVVGMEANIHACITCEKLSLVLPRTEFIDVVYSQSGSPNPVGSARRERCTVFF